MPSSSPWAGWTWVGTPKANLEPHKTLAKFNQRMPKAAYDGRYAVTRVMAKFANHKQSLVLSWWRRWESKTSDFEPIRATIGNHGKPDHKLAESKHDEKHFRETVLPSGKTEAETEQGRAVVGDMPTAETLGALARKVLSSSRHAESRELARAVLQLLVRWSGAK